MKKSFKRSIAVLLSVLMVVCALPFTATAADAKSSDKNPDIQLQFGTFWDTYSMGPLDTEDAGVYDYTLSGIYGPAVDYVNGALVLSADKYAVWNDGFGYDEIATDYTMQVGDKFTVTARLDNVDQIAAFEAAISYSNNIAPFVDDSVWMVDGTLPFLDETLYDGLNDSLLGNLSYVDTDKNVMVISAAANDCDFADVSSTSVAGLTNPATGESGYDFAGQAVIVTFVFEIIAEGPIAFNMFMPGVDDDVTYGGATYVPSTAVDAAPEDYSTYQPDEGANGSTEITFLTKNENVESTGYTITFKNADGSVISSTEYEDGAEVTIPELPKTTNTKTQHTTYAWDVTPSATAVADATYQVVATTADHDYTATEKIPATCNEKGTRTYTCKVCDYSFDAQDIAATGKHTPAEAVRENEVGATCAKAGSYDSVVYCSECTTELSRTPVNIDKTAHSYGEYTYNGDAVFKTTDGTATRVCGNCGYNDTKSIPNTNLLRAVTANAEFGSAVKICLGTAKTTANSFKEVYCKFIRADGVETIVKSDDEKNHYETSSNTMFKYGINPQSLAADVKVIFYAETNDGITVWGPEYTYNMYNNYIKSQLTKSTSSTAWKTLLVELMYFGYENQIKANFDLEHPIIDLLTADQKALHDTAIPNDLRKIQDIKYEEISNPISWSNVNLEYGDATKIRFITAAYTPKDSTRVVVRVEGESAPYEYSYAENPELFSVGSTGKMTFIYPDLPAKRLRSAVYIQVFEGEKAITNVFQYSAETYCYSQLNKDPSAATQNVKITNQLMRYANAAINYFV